MSDTVWVSAIGDAVLTLHQRGEPFDQDRLIAQLLGSVRELAAH